MRSLFLIISILFMISIVSAGLINYDTTTEQYKSFRIKDITNLKYINSYSYEIYINDIPYGEYKKGEIINYPDNSSIRIVPLTETKTSLSSNTFVSIIGAGFFAFMNYGIYILIAFLIIIWLRRRR